MRFIVFFMLSLFIGCGENTRPDEVSIGYIGFIDNKQWAIQFNDCTESEFRGAEKYLWYNRQLTSISCYQITVNDKTHLKEQNIQVYGTPTSESSRKSINQFSELIISESGWGIFPKVYEIADGDWYRVKDGWIHLGPKDKHFVQFYQGTQSLTEKIAHDDYFYRH